MNTFKLYLYGIEMEILFLWILLISLFKLYLYGIEITLLLLKFPVVTLVQIVPLWN